MTEMGESKPLTDGITVRRSSEDDVPGIVETLKLAMGWAGDRRDLDFFTWKHYRGPFGPSPGWLAMDGQRIVGLRTFVRWQFQDRGAVVHAVRAVDTATSPDYRRRGIFSALTRTAIDELRADGFAFIFNTPNERSRGGYLSLGWAPAPRPLIWLRPRSPATLAAISKARVAAQKWSPCGEAGVDAADALADEVAVERLLARVKSGGAEHRTIRSSSYLRWRYGFRPLHYRAVPIGDSMADGLVLYRLRKRGDAREATICDVVLPSGPRLQSRGSLGRLLTDARADYAVAAGPRPRGLGPMLPIPRQGPELLVRPLSTVGERYLEGGLDLTMGDIEAF